MFHCWKANWGLKLSRNLRTPENGHLHNLYYSLVYWNSWFWSTSLVARRSISMKDSEKKKSVIRIAGCLVSRSLNDVQGILRWRKTWREKFEPDVWDRASWCGYGTVVYSVLYMGERIHSIESMCLCWRAWSHRRALLYNPLWSTRTRS